MNAKKQILKLAALSFTVLSSMPVFSVQDVYEYQNKDGVIEFTDQVKDNKKPEKYIQIPKRTAEQEAQSKEKLEGIMEKDKELDKKLAQERKLENERLRREESAGEDKNQPESDDYSRRRDRYGNRYYPPARPVQPIARPKPTHPVNRPGRLAK